jgi:hypothetical protein
MFFRKRCLSPYPIYRPPLFCSDIFTLAHAKVQAFQLLLCASFSITAGTTVRRRPLHETKAKQLSRYLDRFGEGLCTPGARKFIAPACFALLSLC